MTSTQRVKFNDTRFGPSSYIGEVIGGEKKDLSNTEISGIWDATVVKTLPVHNVKYVIEMVFLDAAGKVKYSRILTADSAVHFLTQVSYLQAFIVVNKPNITPKTSRQQADRFMVYWEKDLDQARETFFEAIRYVIEAIDNDAKAQKQG